jgi:hypothetical protein
MLNVAYAYTLLENLPGLTTGTSGPDLTSYLNWLFKFALAAAAFLAVAQIVIGGISMIAGGASETARSNAKKRISDALWGLGLALASWLILFTINPDLANMKLTIPEINIQGQQPTQLPPLTGAYNLSCPDCTSLSTIDSSDPVFNQIANLRITSSTCKDECQFSNTMVAKVEALEKEAAKLGVDWRISEGYPPVVPHDDPCHYTGTCLDIKVKSGVSQDSVNKLIQAAKNAGFGTVLNEYSGYGGKTYETTTGSNIHIRF